MDDLDLVLLKILLLLVVASSPDSHDLKKSSEEGTGKDTRHSLSDLYQRDVPCLWGKKWNTQYTLATGRNRLSRVYRNCYTSCKYKPSYSSPQCHKQRFPTMQPM